MGGEAASTRRVFLGADACGASGVIVTHDPEALRFAIASL